MTPRAPSRHAYAHSLLAPLILPFIRLSIASSAPPTLEMDTPPPIAECAEGTFTWQGGRPPYTLSVRDSHSGVRVFSNSLTDTVFHWVAAVAAGTDLIVELTDTGVGGAGGARLEDNFAVEPGSDACLQSNSGTSSSTSEQASNASASPPSTSTSTSGGQPTPSETAPTSSLSDSTTPATTDTDTDTPHTGSPSSSDGAPSSQTLPGAPQGPRIAEGGAGQRDSDPRRILDRGGNATVRRIHVNFRQKHQPLHRLDDVILGPCWAGTIIGGAVGSLVSGLVLAAGLFCLWRAQRSTRQGRWRRRRRRRERLEPYEYPSAAPRRTVAAASSTTLPSSERQLGHALDFEGAPCQPDANADPVVRERQRPDKDRWDGSSTTQPTTSQRAHLAALNGAEPSRVMDAVDAGEAVQEIEAGDLVRRRWDLRLGDLDVEGAFRLGLDLADYSEHSAFTAPPPYSQIA